MELGQILSLLNPELLIVAVCCYILGMFLKKLPNVKDWVIPFMLLGIAIVFAIVYIGVIIGDGFTATTIISGVFQGILCAALAVFSNELIKQALIKRAEDSEKPPGRLP